MVPGPGGGLGAWSRGAWSWGCLVSGGVPGPGVCGPGYVWSRGCLVETSPRDGHCCGQYTPYWNAFLFLLFLHIYLYISNISHTEVIFDISDIETSMYFDAIYNNYKCEIPQILFNYFQTDRHEVFSFCQAFDPNVNLNVICVKPNCTFVGSIVKLCISQHNFAIKNVSAIINSNFFLILRKLSWYKSAENLLFFFINYINNVQETNV